MSRRRDWSSPRDWTELGIRGDAFRAVRDGYLPKNMPVGAVQPRGAWLTNSADVRGSRLHLVDFALALWLGDEARFYGRAKCGWATDSANFHIEPPHDELCDACVFTDGAKHTVYRYYDGSGRLLYVGYSSKPGVRMLSHAHSSKWFSEVRTHRLEEFANEKAARDAERRAIGAEWPLHNSRAKLARRFQGPGEPR